MKTTEKDPLPTEIPSFDVVAITASAGELNTINVVFVDASRSKNLEDQLKNSTAELETANEELQSNNEELETMNEELQSTNEGLETINDELNQRTGELNLSKSFLETIPGNLKVGIEVVDREFRILNWISMAKELWGLRSDEIMGSSILASDIGLPVDHLKSSRCMVMDEKSDLEELLLEAINRRGKTFTCQITCIPFDGGTSKRQGVVMMMEEKQESK